MPELILTEAPETVTELLAAFGGGDRDALRRLLPQLYAQLRRIARRHLRGERRGHTLNTTALVHEAYLGLVEQPARTWQNRIHFLALASRLMRNLLIDYARRHAAEKRGGCIPDTLLDDKEIALNERPEDLLALDEALTVLAQRDKRLAQVVEYRFFGGMTVKETARLLNVSTMTVSRDWSPDAKRPGRLPGRPQPARRRRTAPAGRVRRTAEKAGRRTPHHPKSTAPPHRFLRGARRPGDNRLLPRPTHHRHVGTLSAIHQQGPSRV